MRFTLCTHPGGGRALERVERRHALYGSSSSSPIAQSTLQEREPLRSFLKPPQSDKIVVAKAAIAVANLRDKEGVDALRAWEADEDIGAFVVLALGRLGASVDQAALRELMTEPISRDQAAVALARLGDRTVMLNHGLDSIGYQKNFQYYSARPGEFERIFSEVIERLTVMQSEMGR